jgi:hypothetical protein
VSHWLDDAARGLAEGTHTRRTVLQRGGAVAAGALVASVPGVSLLTPNTAWAKTRPRQQKCKPGKVDCPDGGCCPHGSECCGPKHCTNPGYHCCHDQGEYGQCPPDRLCCGHKCCGPDQCCHPGGGGIAPGCYDNAGEHTKRCGKDGHCCSKHNVCCDDVCCAHGEKCCPDGGGCCHEHDTCCGDHCCKKGQECCGGACCESSKCHNNVCVCQTDSDCITGRCCNGHCCPDASDDCCNGTCCSAGSCCSDGTCCTEGICCGGTTCCNANDCCNGQCCSAGDVCCGTGTSATCCSPNACNGGVCGSSGCNPNKPGTTPCPTNYSCCYNPNNDSDPGTCLDTAGSGFGAPWCAPSSYTGPGTSAQCCYGATSACCAYDENSNGTYECYVCVAPDTYPCSGGLCGTP